MKKTMVPVIVLGGGLTGLGLAQNLSKRGIDVFLLVDQIDSASYSKYVKKSYISSEMRYDLKSLKYSLKKISSSLNRRVVVFPTSDLDARNLSILKDDVPDDYHFVVGDREPVELLVNKGKFYRAMDKRGIAHPLTYFPENVDQLPKIIGKLTYPIFIKPFVTQLFKKKLRTHMKGFVAHSAKEVSSYYRSAEKCGAEVMLQEIISGNAISSYQLEGYFNADYIPLVLFARKRLRIWPPDFGNTTLCVSVPLKKLNKERNTLNQFMKEIGYHGLMSAEYKRDQRNGELKLLEINARAWWHCWLSSVCGADIIFSSYLDAIGEKTENYDEYKVGIKSIYLGLDVKAAGLSFLNQDLTLKEWFGSLRGPRHFSFFQRDDLFPFVVDTTTIVSRLLKESFDKRKQPKAA